MPKKIIYADDVIDAFRNHVRGGHIILPYEYIKDIVLSLPSAQPHWIPVTKEEMFKAGYEGREIRFRVDGRLFAIRELAQ